MRVRAAVVSFSVGIAGLAGCGLESGEKGDEPSKEQLALAKAAKVTPRAKTARVTYRVRSLPQGRIDLRATGLARLDREEGRYDLLVKSFPGLPPNTRADARPADGVTYLRRKGTKRFGVFKGDAAVPTSIADVLPYLRAITGPIRPVGKNTYKATVDLNLVDEGLPPKKQAGYRVQVKRFVTTKVPVTIRLDSKGRLSRIKYRVERLVEPGPGEDRGIDYEAELSDFGAKGDTSPPPERLIDRE